jgi:hypothetical protein
MNVLTMSRGATATATAVGLTLLNSPVGTPVRIEQNTVQVLTDLQMDQVHGGQSPQTVISVFCAAANQTGDWVVDPAPDPGLPIPCSVGTALPWFAWAVDTVDGYVNAWLWDSMGGYYRVYDAEGGWSDILCNESGCWGGYQEYVSVYGAWPEEFCGYSGCMCDFDSDCQSSYCMQSGYCS